MSQSDAGGEGDVEWLHRFLNCTPFGPPPSEIQRAHRIVDALAAASQSERAKQPPPFVPIDFQAWMRSELSPEDIGAIFARVWDLYDGCPVGEEKQR